MKKSMNRKLKINKMYMKNFLIKHKYLLLDASDGWYTYVD